MKHVARLLNILTGGRLSPNAVTLVGLAAHLPIALLIGGGHYWWAAGLLAVFGLFDALDGELARLQKTANSSGMLLDATTDRMKEVMLYCGAAYVLANGANPALAVWAVAACGFSLCVSYVKAKGETAVTDSGLSPNQINKLFQDGLLRFEVRISILIIGLVSGYLAGSVVVIAVMATYTTIERLVKITTQLQATKG